MMYIIGPRTRRAGAWWPTTYLEVRTLRESIRTSSRNADGIKRLFRQFSWPYGIPSHVAPETPGSIHEGGENWATRWFTAYGAAFDNPNLIVACVVVGDGEAGDRAAGQQAGTQTSFSISATDGAVACPSCT